MNAVRTVGAGWQLHGWLAKAACTHAACRRRSCASGQRVGAAACWHLQEQSRPHALTRLGATQQQLLTPHASLAAGWPHQRSGCPPLAGQPVRPSSCAAPAHRGLGRAPWRGLQGEAAGWLTGQRQRKKPLGQIHALASAVAGRGSCQPGPTCSATSPRGTGRGTPGWRDAAAGTLLLGLAEAPAVGAASARAACSLHHPTYSAAWEAGARPGLAGGDGATLLQRRPLPLSAHR